MMRTVAAAANSSQNRLAVPRSAWQKLRSGFDRIALYLPLMLMVSLALGTYWLVRNTPGLAVPDVAKEARHEVDYFMHNFTIKSFDNAGKLKSEIAGTDARHFADTDILEIDQAKIRSIHPTTGQRTIATGLRAYANGDGSEVQLAGNARVIRESSTDAQGRVLPQLEFRGEFIHAFVNEERVQSHKPVLLIRGNDQFTGDVFAYNKLDQVAVLTGRVRGILMPKPATAAIRPQ